MGLVELRDVYRAGQVELRAHALGIGVGNVLESPEVGILKRRVGSGASAELGKVGVRGGVLDQVLRLAALALSNGCKGVVASALEAGALREEFGPEITIVTPGVRPAGSGPHDQARVVTPAEAIAAGASHIVVGRPITEALDQAAEARAILGQISSQYPVPSTQ